MTGKITAHIEYEQFNCVDCSITYYLPGGYLDARRLDGRRFYCPNGHSMSYTDNEADRIRKERDKLKQDAAYKDDRIKELLAEKESERLRAAALDRKVSAAKGQITKIKKRAAAGLCPVCNRNFVALGRHIHTKHPDYVTEPTADEHVH